MTNRFLLILVIATFCFFIFNACCGTKPVFQDKPPFSISKSEYQDWVGGIPGVSGTSVYVYLSTLDKDVQPDSLFFRQSKSKIDIKTAEVGYLWVGYFRNKSDRDINMHAETDGEYGNKPPVIEKPAFELAENEAVISYLHKGKIAYYKITNLDKMETQHYPAAKPQQ